MEIGKIKYVEKDFASYQATLINRFIDRMSPLKKAVEKARSHAKGLEDSWDDIQAAISG